MHVISKRQISAATHVTALMHVHVYSVYIVGAKALTTAYNVINKRPTSAPMHVTNLMCVDVHVRLCASMNVYRVIHHGHMHRVTMRHLSTLALVRIYDHTTHATFWLIS